MRPALAAFLALLGPGCTTTTAATRDSPAAQAWLAENTSALVRISELDGGRDEAGFRVISASPTQVWFITRNEHRMVPFQNVRRLVVLRHPRGALDGLLAGAGLAASAGIFHALTRDMRPSEQPPDCKMICSRGDAVFWEGLLFGLLGAAGGTVGGAIVGHRDILELQ